MSKTKRNDRKAEVTGISTGDSIKRYKTLLENEFGASDVEDRGEYVLLHKRIKLPDRKFIDIIVYSTDRIYVSGSAYIDISEFGQKAYTHTGFAGAYFFDCRHPSPNNKDR